MDSATLIAGRLLLPGDAPAVPLYLQLDEVRIGVLLDYVILWSCDRYDCRLSYRFLVGE
jgi:hypothetical protein